MKAYWYEIAGATPEDYVHSPDVPITRANIEMAQIRRQQEGKERLTPEQLVRDFVHFPEDRHFARAQRLMTRGRVREAG